MDFDQTAMLGGMTEGESIFPEKISLAMAYIPMQRWESIYEPEKGFAAGTIFTALDLPFKGGRR